MHEKFMKLALAEFLKALLLCRPNPPVGCVLVKSHEVIAKGFTQEIGGMHVKAHALSQIKGDLDEYAKHQSIFKNALIVDNVESAALLRRQVYKKLLARWL